VTKLHADDGDEYHQATNMPVTACIIQT